MNLTLPAVIGAIEDTLKTYPHLYQQTFSMPQPHQELFVYVISRVSNCYVVIDDSQQLSINFKSLPGFCEETSPILALIHEGIEKIIKKAAQQTTDQIPEGVDPEFAPSYWFG